MKGLITGKTPATRFDKGLPGRPSQGRHGAPGGQERLGKSLQVTEASLGQVVLLLKRETRASGGTPRVPNAGVSNGKGRHWVAHQGVVVQTPDCLASSSRERIKQCGQVMGDAMQLVVVQSRITGPW